MCCTEVSIHLSILYHELILLRVEKAHRDNQILWNYLWNKKMNLLTENLTKNAKDSNL